MIITAGAEPPGPGLAALHCLGDKLNGISDYRWVTRQSAA